MCISRPDTSLHGSIICDLIIPNYTPKILYMIQTSLLARSRLVGRDSLGQIDPEEYNYFRDAFFSGDYEKEDIVLFRSSASFLHFFAIPSSVTRFDDQEPYVCSI